MPLFFRQRRMAPQRSLSTVYDHPRPAFAAEQRLAQRCVWRWDQPFSVVVTGESTAHRGGLSTDPVMLSGGSVSGQGACVLAYGGSEPTRYAEPEADAEGHLAELAGAGFGMKLLGLGSGSRAGA